MGLKRSLLVQLWVFVAGFGFALALDVVMQPIAERIYWRRFEKWSAGRTFDGAHGCLIPEPPEVP